MAVAWGAKVQYISVKALHVGIYPLPSGASMEMELWGCRPKPRMGGIIPPIPPYNGPVYSPLKYGVQGIMPCLGVWGTASPKNTIVYIYYP